MNKEELYKKALSNIHRYSLLNEIFAIRDERFSKEQQENMLCVNGYIGIDTLNRYVRNIDELVEYQNIDTIENLKEKDKEIEKLKNGYCELKVKCNNGECDCTNEEYDGMVESNIKLSLEVDRLNNIINLIKNNIDITIQIIKEQPIGNVEWILERLNGIKNIGKELKEGNK